MGGRCVQTGNTEPGTVQGKLTGSLGIRIQNLTVGASKRDADDRRAHEPTCNSGNHFKCHHQSHDFCDECRAYDSTDGLIDEPGDGDYPKSEEYKEYHHGEGVGLQGFGRFKSSSLLRLKSLAADPPF